MAIASLIVSLLITIGSESDRSQSQSAPILLDFSATWCGPCKATRPEVDRLKADGYPVRVVDIDQSPDLKNRYKIDKVPTFIVVDPDGRELDRLPSGATTARELARFYNEAKRKWQSDDSDPEPVADDEGSDGPESLHRPWETVVRIKVYNNLHKNRPSIGYGSGTIIHSTDDEAIILTCAHIFHIEELKETPPPSKFPLKVKVDLFDGRLSGGKTPQVHTTEVDIAAEVIDYNFSGDVGLVRIRPGRKLPSSQVVPPGWTPRENQKLTTLGCSQGHDATAWSTHVTRTTIKLQTQNGIYEGTECAYPPLQGRSGGGLFTLDGVLAGVCDFNDGPRGEHGLYASPKTIHRMLDKHKLQVCYAGQAGDRAREQMLAAGSPARSKGNVSVAAREPITKVRSQSPGPEGELPIPSPEVLGISLPKEEVAQISRKSRTRVSQPGRADRWKGQDETRDVERPVVSGGSFAFMGEDQKNREEFTAGLQMAASATGDLFAAAPDDLHSIDSTPPASESDGIPWHGK